MVLAPEVLRSYFAICDVPVRACQLRGSGSKSGWSFLF